ncbi:MAG: hypothetical protein GEU98_08190 [Pseudonocardiaceae bacterium]|nr:hypothetical protein [Pseudonocardiaceae bacterium]
MGSRGRRTAAVGAAAFVLAGTTTLTTTATGTATAAPAPIVVGSCGATVQGKPGQPVTLDVAAALGKRPGTLGMVSLGTVQDGYRTIGLPVTNILNQVGQLPVVGDLLAPLRGAAGGVCNVTTKAVNTAAAPVQEVTKPAGQAVGGVLEQGLNTVSPPPQRPGPGEPAPGQPGPGQPPPHQGGGEPGGSMPPPDSNVVGGLDPAALRGFGGNFGRSPMADYSSLPFANPGLFAPSPGVRYGGQVPGYAPEFGILGGEKGKDKDGVRNAGEAQALSKPNTNDVALPVLLGVFALTGVIAALVRTWVLRRTA